MSNSIYNTRDTLINYKVYIAGQYAPAQEIVAQQGIFSFSEAKITLFPHKDLIDFGENDRVPVQIFFLDTLSDFENAIDYKLMFEGEIIDVSYTRTPNSIGVSVSAISHFEILTQMFKKLFTDLDSQIKDETGQVSTNQSELNIASLAGDNLLSNFSDIDISNKSFEMFFNKSFTKERTTKVKSTDSYLTRPFVLLRNIVMDLINGVSQEDITSDIALFFKAFISKRNIYKTMFASPILEEGGISKGQPTANIILNAIDDSATINMIIDGLSKLSRILAGNNMASYWEITTRVMSVFLYEVLQPLCPPYLKANIFGVPTTDNSKYDGIMHLLTKPTIYFGIPPLCNTIFPCMINSINYTNNHFTKPTRFYLTNPDVIIRNQKSGGAVNNTVTNIMINHTSSVYPPTLKTNGVIDPKTINKQLLWDSEGNQGEFFKGPVILQSQQAPDWINYVRKNLTGAQALQSYNNGKVLTSTEINKIGDGVQSVTDMYAATEFEKETSSRKMLSIDMKFNPFIMPGFPAAIVDNIDYGVYFLAMPIQVVHHLSTSGASTSVSFTNTISFKDAYSNYKKISNLNNPTINTYDMGPVHPSWQVADIFNKYTGAINYYTRLLYQGSLKTNVVFRPTDYFIMDENMEISLVKDRATVRGVRPGVKDNQLKYIVNYVDAMKLISRPITSLAQYINSRKSLIYMNYTGTASTLGISDPTVGGIKGMGAAYFFNGTPISRDILNKQLRMDQDPTVDPIDYASIYYDKILTYSYLSQINPKTKVPYFTNKPTDVSNYPDFIKDWAGKIEQYRKDILNTLKDFYIG